MKQRALAALEEEDGRDRTLERLAALPGFYVPEHHRPEDGDEIPKLEKRELTEDQMKEPGHLPTTAIVTPRTEFSEKFLIEMSRGCPEKCRYCWATFGMGRFRWHPTDYILGALERARPVTNQLGFVATAVGDHPDIEKIVRQKAVGAFGVMGHPCVVEHGGLFMEALPGLPGSVGKIVWDAVGERLCGFLRDSDSRAATVRCYLGYCDGRRIRVYIGETRGHIADRARGDYKFAWDPIFIPEGQSRTYGEMGLEQKRDTSPIYRAWDAFFKAERERVANRT